MLSKNIFYTSILFICIAGCTKDNNTSNSVTPSPSGTTTYNVNSVTNVQYGQNTTYTNTNQSLLMDIYLPKDASASKNYPLVVMAHGGSFLTGDKNNLSGLCQAIAEKGFITVSIDYRLGWNYGNAQSPSACDGDTLSLQEEVYRSLQDYNAALRYLVHNASTYFINPNWIFIGGLSAGAVAAVNTIYVTNDFANSYFKNEQAQLGDLKTADNSLTDAFTIKGDINLWGAIISPALITPATAVPMVAFHGSADETVPFNYDHYALCPNYPLLYGSQYMYNVLTGYGVPAVLHIAEGQGHGPAMYSDDAFVSTNINCFLQSVMNKSAVSATFQNLTSPCQ